MAFSIGVRMLNPHTAGIGGLGGRMSQPFARKPLPSPTGTVGGASSVRMPAMASMPGGRALPQTPFAGVPGGYGSQTQRNANTPPPAGGGAAHGSPYDLSTDPLVQKIIAMNSADYQKALAETQAAGKQDLIQSGFNFADVLKADPALRHSIFGQILGDRAAQQAAIANPYSTAKNLAGSHFRNNRTIDTTDNANNLYYSSTRGNQLSDESHNYLGQVDQAQTGLRDALTSLIQNLDQVQQTGLQNLAGGYDTARQNAIGNASAAGQSFLGYDSNGNPIFSNPASAPASAQSAVLPPMLAYLRQQGYL